MSRSYWALNKQCMFFEQLTSHWIYVTSSCYRSLQDMEKDNGCDYEKTDFVFFIHVLTANINIQMLLYDGVRLRFCYIFRKYVRTQNMILKPLFQMWYI